MAGTVWDTVLPVAPGTVKKIRLGSCALELVCSDERAWDVTECIGTTVINHGRLVSHDRHYTVTAGGTETTAGGWERTLRLHLGIR